MMTLGAVRTIFIQTETTPNPDALKFLPGQTVMAAGSREFATPEAAEASPLAQAIFDTGEVVNVNGVRVVDTNPRVVTVNLENQVTNKVPVTTRAVGQLPIGYELGTMAPATNAVLGRWR